MTLTALFFLWSRWKARRPPGRAGSGEPVRAKRQAPAAGRGALMSWRTDKRKTGEGVYEGDDPAAKVHFCACSSEKRVFATQAHAHQFSPNANA